MIPPHLSVPPFRSNDACEPNEPPHCSGFISLWDFVRWRLTRRKVAAPASAQLDLSPPIPHLRTLSDDALARTETQQLTWLGHASVLIQLAGKTIWIDPVLSDRLGRFIRRRSPLGLRAAALPQPDLLLITHNHRDHLDEPTVRQLPRTTRVIVPSGLGSWFCRRGFNEVDELGWWEQCLVGSLEITSVPAHHWSRRTPWDTNRTGWCGFVLRQTHVAPASTPDSEPHGLTLYHAGDTGWFEEFQEVGNAFPGLDVVLMPVGGYAPAWLMDRHHLNPEQAGEAFRATGGRTLIPIHWGTFPLSDEPPDEPIRRLQAWWDGQPPNSERRLVIPEVGAPLPIRP